MCGHACAVEAAARDIAELAPELVLLDLRLPGTQESDAVRTRVPAQADAERGDARGSPPVRCSVAQGTVAPKGVMRGSHLLMRLHSVITCHGQ
ncbi:hypothetical protein GCM10020367_07520 [Streptomyces sannanensis]|uniref:Response regulator n=1 Tax=Streptomyces sannanensis TaxID=285536 RepID=A0ABP6S6E1_9ACTN